MKTPVWEASPGALIAFLNTSTEVFMCDLFTFTVGDGTVIRYTDAQSFVSQPDGSRSWGIGPKLERSKVTCSVGVEVDSLQVTLHAEPSVTVNGMPITQAFAQGYFDGADVLVERMFLDSSGAPQGILWVFDGTVGEVVVTRGHVELEVVSYMQLLQSQVPGELIQPSCRNNLYGLNCGVSRTAFTFHQTVSAAASRSQFSTSFSGVAAVVSSYFDLGTVKFLSGANTGLSRTVKQQTGSGAAVVINTVTPFPNPIAAGDAFVVVPGCDKTRATCIAKFNNLSKFQGEPFVPVPQTVT